MGRIGSMDGRDREMCNIDAEELDVDMEESGGV